MINFKNRSIRALIIVMSALVVSGIAIAWIYYHGINSSVDPRVKAARELYRNYNIYAENSQYDSVFWLLDTMETIYNSNEHYKNSFEKGVIYTDRAAVLLTIFINPDIPLTSDDSIQFLDRAEQSIMESINIYQKFSSRYEGLDENGIRESIRPEFFPGLQAYPADDAEKFLDNRAVDIKKACDENDRRLSVCYANLGLVKRYQYKYDSAAFYYLKAVELWDMNLSAENNLNILLNRPLKKAKLIHRIFPPKK